MDGNTPLRSGQAAPASTSRRIKNTFAPSCENEYFDPGALFHLCKYGFPFEDLPAEAKEMVLEYADEYAKRCIRDGDKADLPPFPTGPGVRIA